MRNVIIVFIALMGILFFTAHKLALIVVSSLLPKSDILVQGIAYGVIAGGISYYTILLARKATKKFL